MPNNYACPSHRRCLRRVVTSAAMLILLATLSPAMGATIAADWNPAAVRAFLDQLAKSVQGGQASPQWLSDSEFWYRSEVDDQAWLVNVDSGLRTPAPDKARLKKAIDEQLPDAEGAYEILAARSASSILLLANNTCYELALASYTVRRMDSLECLPYENPPVVRKMFPIEGWSRREILSPDHQWFASLIDDDFAVHPQNGSDPVFRTNNGTASERWFFAGDLWEESSTPWSPDSRHVVYRRHDMRDVPGVDIIDFLGEADSVSRYRYWARVGDPPPVTTFHVFDVVADTSIAIDYEGDSDSLAFFLGWSADSEEFYFVRYSRDLRALDLYSVNPVSGRIQMILTESRGTGWVKWPGGPELLTPLPSGDGFIWRSDRDGWFQLYLYDRAGRLVRQLTNGEYPVANIIGIDEKSGWIYYLAASDAARPYDRQINRVPLGGGKATQLTSEPGQHSASLSPDFNYLVDNHYNLDRPPRADMLRSNGAFIRTIEHAKLDEDFRRGWSTPEEFKVRLPKYGTDIHGVIYKPPNFDPTKLYPVIERLYGGMQGSSVNRGFPGAGLQQWGSEYTSMLNYLTQLGFVVIAMDTPGTPGRGREFNLATYGKWPLGIIDDHTTALADLFERHSYLDKNRVGIDGNSFGGQLALRALIDGPDVYKAAAASVPETDLIDSAHWMEFQLGSLANNREHYTAESIIAHAGNLQGDLLLVAGMSDVNVPVSNTFKLLDALAENNKRYELVLFPGTNHAHMGRGDRYAYAINRIGLFFKRALDPCTRQ